MELYKNKTVSFSRRPQQHGGPGSFQTRLEEHLATLDVNVIYKNSSSSQIPDAICVFSSTKHILWLLKMKLLGVRVILRLDGINWQHRVEGKGLWYWLYSELDNLMMYLIFKFLADRVIFQSEYVKHIWVKGNKRSDSHYVIYNSVDMNVFKPDYPGIDTRMESVLCVEGEVNGKAAINILNAKSSIPVHVYGKVPKGMLDKINNPFVVFNGVVHRDLIPDIMRKHKVYLCLETCPACPNSVIEAMSSGLPIIGFDSGSLKEIVGENAGVIVDYGDGVPALLDPPDTSLLGDAIDHVLANYDEYSTAARSRAVAMFSSKECMNKYVDVFFN